MAKHTNIRKTTKEEMTERHISLQLARVCSFIIAVAIAFCLGFILRGNDVIMQFLGIDRPSVANSNPGLTTSGNTYDSIGARVAEVEGLLASESLINYDLSAATSACLNSFAGSINDPYLTYFDEARYRNYVSEASSNTNAGIGVLLSEHDGNVFAVDVFDNGPAAAAGVVQNDMIVAIGGNNVEDWTATEIANALSKEEGNEVVVTWRRTTVSGSNSGTEEFTTTITCSRSSKENVSTDLVDEVGYIKLRQLTKNSADLVAAALSDLSSRGARAFVFDLRDCPGGYLSQAVDIASLFITSGNVVQIQTAEELTSKAVSGVTKTNAPLVVLINSNTAAAAEVLAAALQDSKRATLVGLTTLGKGSVQVIRELSFGGALRYTAARYISPAGHELSNSGVSPDIRITLASDGTDNQLSIAYETALNLIVG